MAEIPFYYLAMVTEKSCNLSKYQRDYPRESERRTSSASSDEHSKTGYISTMRQTSRAAGSQ